MVKNLVSKSQFSIMAGVSAAAITKACGKALAGALVGKRIDANCKAAQNYINKQTKPPPKIGVDDYYEEAVEICEAAGKCSVRFLKNALNIGTDRSKKIVATMRLNDAIPKKPEKKSTGSGPPPKIVINHVRGHVAAKETKKKAASEAPVIYDIPADIEEFADMTLRDLISKFGTDVRFCDWLNATKSIEAINEKRLKNAATKGDLVSRKLVKDAVISPVDTCHRRLLTDGARSLSIRVAAMHDAGEDQKTIEKYIHNQITSFIRPMKAKISKALRDIGGKE